MTDTVDDRVRPTAPGHESPRDGADRRSSVAASPAHTFTVVGFILCLGAAVAAWRELPTAAVTAWLLGRAFDGLDGAVARASGTAGDRGGYADILLDTIGYAAVPIGIAFGADDVATWRIVAVLVAAFYVNSVSWLMLSALLEKRSAGSDATGEYTSVTMPPGLIEGAETIVLFAIALAVPAIAPVVFMLMTIGVTIGVLQRAAAARRLLTP